jgi:hypothetical protein
LQGTAAAPTPTRPPACAQAPAPPAQRPSRPPQSAAFRVRGMSCASCVTTLEGVLRPVPGVLGVSVSLLSESCKVRHARS